MFSGSTNRRAATSGRAGAIGASLDGSNCHGVSGDAGAKSRVSLQAPSSAHPARALRRNLAGDIQCVPDPRRHLWLQLRTNLIKNFADILLQPTVPRRERGEVITRTGQTTVDITPDTGHPQPTPRPHPTQL